MTLQEVFLLDLKVVTVKQKRSLKNIFAPKITGGSGSSTTITNAQDVLQHFHPSMYFNHTYRNRLSHQTERVRPGQLAQQGSKKNPDCVAFLPVTTI